MQSQNQTPFPSEALAEERKADIAQQQEFHDLLREQMQVASGRRANATAFAHIGLSFVTAPLITMGTSLQCSLPQNRVTMEHLAPQQAQDNAGSRKAQVLKGEALGQSQKPSRIQQLIGDKQTTVRQNRSMGMWQPFRPASYTSYGEAMKGLYRQGTPLAYYKGNGVRSLHIILFHKLNHQMSFQMEDMFGQQWVQLKKVPIVQELVLSCTVDMLLQPLHVAEARFIMQNRRNNFRTYKSMLDYLRNTPVRDMLRGNLLHFPRNFLVALSGMKITDQVTIASYYG